MSLASIEDALIADTQAAYGNKLKAVDHLPGEWNDQTLRRMATNAPAVYWAYLGGKRHPQRDGYETGVFHGYVFTGAGNDEKQRRRGDQLALGAYQLVDTLVSYFDNREVAGQEALKWLRTDNLFSDFLHANGITGYRVAFELVRELPRKPTQSELGEFLKSYQTYDPAPKGGKTLGTDKLQLRPEEGT
jgi:phage gp37-like protein